MEFNIVYDRREQADTFGGSTSRWRAFQTGRTLAELEEVRWKKIDPIGTMGWVRVNSDGSIYFENGIAKLWAPNTLNLWEDISI